MDTFKPTAAMIKAAETVFLAMLAVEMTAPVVTKYKREILAEGQWPVRDEFSDRAGTDVILEPDRAWLMSDENFIVYDSKCKAARKLAGLPVNDESQCPLLVSQHNLSLAETELADALSSVSPMNGEILNMMMPELRKQAVDVMLKLMASFVNNKLPDLLAA